MRDRLANAEPGWHTGQAGTDPEHRIHWWTHDGRKLCAGSHTYREYVGPKLPDPPGIDRVCLGCYETLATTAAKLLVPFNTLTGWMATHRREQHTRDERDDDRG